MNLRLRQFAFILLMIAGGFCLPGCASLSGGSDVYSIKETQLHVHWKMVAYHEAWVAGSVTEGQSQMVASAKQAYDQALQKALSDAGGNLDAPTPPALQDAANQLLFAVSDVLSTLTP